MMKKGVQVDMQVSNQGRNNHENNYIWMSLFVCLFVCLFLYFVFCILYLKMRVNDERMKGVGWEWGCGVV